MEPLHFVDRAEIQRSLTVGAAADALEAALLGGLDVEAEPQRIGLPFGEGELLIMPSDAGGPHSTVKLNTIGGDPRVQGVVVVFETSTLAPVALLDGVELTNLRTAAVSLLAARRLCRNPVGNLVVFGRGPQGLAHAAALAEGLVASATRVLHSASDPREIEEAVGQADLICCATTARTPLFDGRLLPHTATVIALGSHEPDAREVDASVVRAATVVVESRRSASSEAGDLVMAGVDGSQMITLAELVVDAPVDMHRPRLFKSTGMGWEDAVVTNAILGP